MFPVLPTLCIRWEFPMARSLVAMSLLAVILAIPAARTTYGQAASEAQKLLDDIERLKRDPEILEIKRRNDLMTYEDNRSKIGFMTYCGEKELIDRVTANKSSDIYTRYVAFLFHNSILSPKAYDRDAGDEAETQGRRGFFYYKNWQPSTLFQDPRGSPSGKSLDEYAGMGNESPAELCRRWADEAAAREPSLKDVEAMTKAFETYVPSGSEQKR
jgi:hypothetical protein